MNGGLVTAMGSAPSQTPGGLPNTGTLTYTRRIYVGDRNDVRSVSNDIFPELASRPLANPVINGTISGNVDAADDDVGTGGPDLVRGIYPSVKAITQEGFTDVP